MKLILASNSKQRQGIFDMLGLKYDVMVSDEEENSSATDPGEYVKELSITKANSVARRINEKAIIISADSIIYMDGKKYEKPKEKEEAFNNIKEMSGKKTYAYTGVTIKDLYQDKQITFYDVCTVYIKSLSDEDIEWYVNNEEKVLKVCGYAILGKASIFMEKIDGDVYTLYGISPNKIYAKLRELGYKMSDFELK